MNRFSISLTYRTLFTSRAEAKKSIREYTTPEVVGEDNGASEGMDEVRHAQRNARGGESVWLMAGSQQPILH